MVGKYSIPRDLITSTIKSDPGFPGTRAISEGSSVSAFTRWPFGGSALGNLLIGSAAPTDCGVTAAMAPVVITLVKKFLRPEIGSISSRFFLSVIAVSLWFLYPIMNKT